MSPHPAWAAACRRSGLLAQVIGRRGMWSPYQLLMSRPWLTGSHFAGWLWSGRAGTPPAGLTTNAGLWYLDGFRAALQDPSSDPVRASSAGDRT
jgi:hypothetical protein